MKNQTTRRVGNNGNGGKKGVSGRKPKAFTMLKQRIESEKKEDAEYAFSLYVSAMRDEGAGIELRLDCADWVANRVLGKPTQPMGQDPSMPFDSNMISIFVHDDSAA